MWKKAIGLGIGMVLAVSAIGALAEHLDVVVSAVNTSADLDLSGKILYAVNFGNTGSPTVGGVVFSPDEQCPGITIKATNLFEANAVGWGPAAGTEDVALNALLSGLAATATPSDEIRIDAQGLIPGKSYLLQMIAYEPERHSRSIAVLVEGEAIIPNLNPLAAQGGVPGKGGLVIKYRFTAIDPVLNIRLVNHSNACAISGLVLTQLTPESFADYGSGTTTELVSGKGTWQINWGQGPWTWTDNTGATLFGSNVSSVLVLHTTAPAKVSADMVATLAVQGDLLLTARDKSNADVVIGTMSLSGTGVNIVDLNASRVIVDQGSGIGMAPFHAPGPELAMTLNEATGVFAYIRQTADWRLQLAGLYAMPLAGEGITQTHILAALGGKVPLIGGLGTFALSGQYDPVESMKPQSFCEYGTAVAMQFGAAGGLWQQIWGGGPWSWRTCPAGANAKTLLGENVFGKLETTTSGAPSIDRDMVLRSPFGGQITLTDYDSAAQIEGQLKGDVTGTFVADVNAANATLDSDGNIVCRFGVAVQDAPDALITVTEATGIYADIRQAGEWGWYVNGTMTIARVPDLPLQQNILAALQKPELLLGAQEEFVLTGWYYRASQD
jgi:hypothetical protein